MVISRRIRSLAAVAALGSLATLPTAADAQPTCVTAAAFVSESFSPGCTLDGITFTNFSATFSGVLGPTPAVAVMPFSGGGPVGFNLVFSPALATSSFGVETFDFGFTASGVGTGGTLGISPASLFTAVLDISGGDARHPLTADVQMSAVAASTGAGVLIEAAKGTGLPDLTRCVVNGGDAPCGALVTTAFAGGRVHLTGRVQSTGVPVLPALASISNLGVVIGPGTPVAAPPVTVAPEPAPVLLLGSGGLLALAGVRRRRRVASSGGNA